MKAIQNTQDYENIIKDGKPVLLDFYADWCGPCQALLPTIEKLSKLHEADFNIVKVNVDDNQELAQQFGVRSIPTLAFINNGKVQEVITGVQAEDLLEQKIQAYKA
jgi:thioredoxin